MSHRPVVFVSGLTVGDYLLWNWSLSGDHGVLALVSGLTLPPLALACAWLVTISVARLLAYASRRPRRLIVAQADGDRAARSQRPRRRRTPGRIAGPRSRRRPAPPGVALDESAASTGTADRSSRKLAA